MIFKESALAHLLLDGLSGIEIGASAHNPFNIDGCLFVDYTADMDTIFKQEEERMCGRKQHVDVAAVARALPFADESLEYVLSSHVIEHCWDVIGTVEEWFRVLKPGGFIFMIIPNKEKTFDAPRPCTTFDELRSRHNKPIPKEIDNLYDHFSVWIPTDWFELITHYGWAIAAFLPTDDKVGNGFTVVLRK